MWQSSGLQVALIISGNTQKVSMEIEADHLIVDDSSFEALAWQMERVWTLNEQSTWPRLNVRS